MKLPNFLVTATLGLALVIPAGLVPAADAQTSQKQTRNAAERAWTGAEEAFPGRQGTPRTAILVNADGSQGEVIEYVDYDGEAIFGGDMVLHVEEGYAAFHRDDLDRAFGSKSAGRTADSRLWPGGVVPYIIDSGVSSAAKGWIADAMVEWESLTQIRFVQRTDEDDYLYFTAINECKSSVGRTGGLQNIWVNGCSRVGSAIHEIGHAVGLYHEHMRADRDSYVTIHWGNIKPDSTHNFSQYTVADGADIGAYDYRSIMHYGCWSASTGGRTITPVSGTSLCSKMGQRDTLSDGDIAGIAMLYPRLTMVAANYRGTTGQGNVLYQVDSTNASTSQSRSIFGGATCVTDMDFHPDARRLYGVDCSDTHNAAGSKILQLDFSTGIAMPLFSLPSGRKATSIAVSADGNDLYAIDQKGTGWGTLLYKISLKTGQVTDIGTLSGGRTQASSIAVSDDGILYAIDNTYNNGAGAVLFTIDTTTAQTSTIGWMGGDRTHATSIRFGSGGTLYGINNNANGKGKVLFLIDTGDASTRDIAVLSGEQRWATSLAIFH